MIKDSLIQILEDSEGIDSLKQGDVVLVEYQPSWDPDVLMLCAYHGISDRSFFQFLVPAFSEGKEYIAMFQVEKRNIKVRLGSIFMNENRLKIEKIYSNNESYACLDETLKFAGIKF